MGYPIAGVLRLALLQSQKPRVSLLGVAHARTAFSGEVDVAELAIAGKREVSKARPF
jgi:hypothetical protein